MDRAERSSGGVRDASVAVVVLRLRSAADNAPQDAADCSGAPRYANDAKRAPYCRSASSTFHGDVSGDDSSPAVVEVPLRGTAASSSSAALECA